MSNTRVYIANLGKYNEGELVGKWIDLPFDEEELQELFVRIKLGRLVDSEYVHGYEENGCYYEEFAIHDWETEITGLDIGEFDDPRKLSELIEEYDGLCESDANTVMAAMECFGYSLDEAISKVSNFVLYPDIENHYDLGYYWAVESGCYEVDSNNPLSHYIDYEAFGRDIEIDNNGGFTSKGYIEEC